VFFDSVAKLFFLIRIADLIRKTQNSCPKIHQHIFFWLPLAPAPWVPWLPGARKSQERPGKEEPGRNRKSISSFEFLEVLT
jgi:hypothetical protein